MGAPQADTGVRHETFDLAAHAASVATARRRTLAWLTGQAVAAAPVETAVLIVSEFVANAVVHSGGDAVSCALQLHDDLLRIEVTDRGASCYPPSIRHATPDDVSGRGLLLVSHLSEAWGAERAAPSGWTVWATVRTTV